MILLSLALVVAAAATLAWGVFASSDPLVWVSLAAGLGAVALVAGAVVRHRRQLLPEGVPDAGAPTAGSAAVDAASAGVDPARSPTPSRPASSASAPPAGPVSPPGAWPGVPPDPRSWPWTTPPPGGPPTGAEPPPGVPPDPRSWPWTTPPPGSPPTGAEPPPGVPSGPPADGPRAGWTGPVPVTPPTPDPTADPWERVAEPWDRTAEPTAAARPPAEPQPPAEPRSPEPRTPEPRTAEPRTAEPRTPDLPTRDEPHRADAVAALDGEPGVEEVAVRDALRVAQLADEVLVVDGHPRYHLAGCPVVAGAETVPLAVSAARRGGFTPCADCRPDATLLARSRDRARQRAQDNTAGRPNGDGQQL